MNRIIEFYLLSLGLLLCNTTWTSDPKEILKAQRAAMIREELINPESPHSKEVLAHYAIEDGNWPLVQYALEKRTDPCYIAEQIVDQHPDLFEQTVKLCANINILRLQALADYAKCKAQCIEILHRNKVNIDSPDAITGKTPLHSATTEGNTKKVKRLVACNADVLRKDKAGKTPVDYAEGFTVDISRNTEKVNPWYLQLILALQRGTNRNLLDPKQHPFYDVYRQRVLDSKAFPDFASSVPCNRLYKNDWEQWCLQYRAYGSLIQAMREAIGQSTSQVICSSSKRPAAFE